MKISLTSHLDHHAQHYMKGVWFMPCSHDVFYLTSYIRSQMVIMVIVLLALKDCLNEYRFVAVQNLRIDDNND